MAKRIIHLIRHGQYDIMAKNKLGGRLTGVGLVQAEMTAKALRLLPVTGLYSSVMLRAVETAQTIGAEFTALKLKRSRVLCECVPTIPPRFADYFAKRTDLTTQALAEAQEQIETAFVRYFKPAQTDEDQHDVIVAHGNVIRYLVCRVMEVDPNAWGNLRIYHCGITRIQIEPDGMMFLVSHNDVGHLPPHMWTEL